MIELSNQQLNEIENEVYQVAPVQPYEDEWCEDKKKKVNDFRSSVRERLKGQLIKKLMSATKTIGEVNIDLSNPVFKETESVDDLKKLELFSKFPEDQQETFYNELFETIKNLRVKDY